MAITNFDGSLTGSMVKHHKIYLECNETATSITDNTSTVTVKLKLYNDGGGLSWVNGNPYTIKINGTSYTGKFDLDTRGSAHTDTLATISNKVITHDSDGSKSISVSASFTTVGGIVGITSGTASGTWKLTTIPRASSISSCTTSVTANDSNKLVVGISRKSSSFTHDVAVTFGSHTYTKTGVGTSFEYAIPTSWLSAIPSATSGTATVKVTTKSGSTTIGSAVSKTFTIKVPTYKPTLDSFTITPVYSVSTDSAWGWVAGRTKAKVTIASKTSYSAKISSYKITGTGISSTTTTGTSTNALTSGTHSYTVTITDSRGMVVTSTKSITVAPYSAPALSTATATRNSNGNVTVKAVYSCDSFSGNTANCRVDYKLSTGTEWTSWCSLASGSTETMAFDTDKSYHFRFTVTDKYLTTVVTKTVSTVAVSFDMLKGGKGVAFGKVSEMTNFLDVAYSIACRGHFHMGYNLDTERSIYFSNTGTGKYPHQCRVYGGNAESPTGIGAYDSLNKRTILSYNDQSNALVSSVTKVDMPSANILASSYRISDDLGNEKNCIKTFDGDGNGVGLEMSAGGCTIVGSGEAPANYQAHYNYNGATEQLHLVSDNSIFFGVNCNTIADHKRILINSSYIYPEVTKAFSCGHSSYRWNNGYFNTIYNSAGTITSSDERLKKDIVPIPHSKEFILGLEPVQYSYINGDTGRTHFGLKAQQVKETLDKVGIEDCGVYVELPMVEGKERSQCRYDELELGVRYEELIPPLIDLVKSQQKEIEELKEITKSLIQKLG